MPFERTIGPLELTLLNFRTDSGQKNLYAFSGVTDGGEQFAWKGFFSLDPFRSEGEFSLEGVSLTKIRAALPGFVPLRDQGRGH